MRNSNLFTLRGRTTADIELKKTGNDIPVCNFTLAVDRPYRKDKDKETDFMYVTAYRNTAEFVSKYVPKGTMIAVSGEIRMHTWEQEGQRRSRVDLIAEDVEFAGPKQSGSSSEGDTERTSSRAASAPVSVSAEDDVLPF